MGFLRVQPSQAGRHIQRHKGDTFMTTPAERQRAALQEHILDEVKAATGAKDAEISEWASCDRTMLSHWRSGSRSMSVGDLLGIIRGAGDATPVLRRLASAGDCDVRRRPADATGNAYAATMHALGNAGHLVQDLAQAIQDGRIDGTEARSLLAQLDAHQREMDQLRAELAAVAR
jgi:hypothetical protein